MSRRHEIKGLDTLRFVAAATVALSHGAAFPLGDWLGKGSPPARLLVGAYDVSFDGVAAVIVFFVISGFCIHHGPASGAPFRVLPFWTRRGVRILGPLIGAYALAKALGAAATGALEVVLWSIYCELIYYALYPLLRFAFRRFGLADRAARLPRRLGGDGGGRLGHAVLLDLLADADLAAGRAGLAAGLLAG